MWSNVNHKSSKSVFTLSQVCCNCTCMSFQSISIHQRSERRDIGTHLTPNCSYLIMVISHNNDIDIARTFNSITLFSDLIRRIRVYGRINQMDANEVRALREVPLMCHRCNFRARFIEDLKGHLLVHLRF